MPKKKKKYHLPELYVMPHSLLDEEIASIIYSPQEPQSRPLIEGEQGQFRSPRGRSEQ